MNHTENTTIVGVPHGKNLFLATVLARSCNMPSSQVKVNNFFSLPEFLFSACLFVTFANLGPILIGLVVQLKRLLQHVLSLCCKKCCTKPQVKPATEGLEESTTIHDINEAVSKASETLKAEACPTVDAEDAMDVVVPILEEQPKAAMSALLGEEQDDDGGKGGASEAAAAEKEETDNEEEDNERVKVMEMWTNVIHAALTLYTIWSYLVLHVPPGASGMCRAAHMIIVPLFKPATASMWPALMPLVQFAQWQSQRSTEHPEQYMKA